MKISVIVRARDEQIELRRCLEILAAQDTGGREIEVVVVDGGSVDATTEVAKSSGAKVVILPPKVWTYGAALNLGCANASGDALVAVSAHAYPPDDGWLARIVEPLESVPATACACGDPYGPDGRPLRERVVQDEALARLRPEWGYSNAAGAFSGELWRRRPFRADLPGCEDKEWSWHWLRSGYKCVIDPALILEHDHTHDPVKKVFKRAAVEWEGYGSYLDLPSYGPRQLAADWWSDTRWYDSRIRARVSPRRTARLLGAYAGRRRARR
jgi:glycosyltransferase involved in cell wall biosynthesis